MEFTREVLGEIVEKASTLDERLANGYFVPRPNADQSEIKRRLDRWCGIAAKGDREQFQKLLLLAGLDLDSIKAGLGPVRLSDRATLPDWMDLLQEGLREAAACQQQRFRFLDPAEPWPFEQIVAPFVHVASQRLRANTGAAYDGLTENAHARLERKLLHWLVNVSSSALMLEFSIFRLTRDSAFGQKLSQLVAGNSNEIYSDFCGQMLNRKLVPFLQEYSVLARAIALLVKNWIDTAAEFLDRLALDRTSIMQAFNAGEDPGKVEDLSAGLSDPHRGGRNVFALMFSSGLKLVYKPKSLETEAAYTRLVEWINHHKAGLQLKGLHVLPRPGYGWVEFVDHHAPADDSERSLFYRRSGMLLCLFYVLGSTDVHAENLIAAGEHPVLIDAETLITPSLEEPKSGETGAWAETEALHRMNSSVLRVGMLPWWRRYGSNQIQDLSALGGVGGEDVLASVWQGIETDNLERQVVTGRTARNGNVPFAADETADPSRYVEDVVHGFREMYNFLRTQGGALLCADSPLDELACSPMRLVFRDTSTYFSILKNSFDASVLRDGVDRSIQLELLSRVLLVSDSNARFKPFLKAEKQSIANLDIPFFTVHPQSRAMNTGDEIIESCFTQAGYERVGEVLSGLGSENLENQIHIICGSFWAKAVSTRCTQTRDVEADRTLSLDPQELSTSDLIEEALKIARKLEYHAIPGSDGSITWLSIVLQPGTQTYRFAPLGPGLFDGLAGIALFLAALENIGADSGFRQLALRALRPICRAIDSGPELLSRNNKSALQDFSLGLTGFGGIIYALTCVGQLLHDEAPLAMARSAASLVNPDFFATDTGVDVFSGSAGATLGLLSLHEIRPDSFLLDTAIILGERICERLEAEVKGSGVKGSGVKGMTGGVAAGFVHGQAGVAHALLRLHRATNERRFLNAARNLMLVASSGTEWELLDTGWRAGAAGLGLVWLHNLVMLDDGEGCYSLAVDAALDRCLTAPLSGPDQLYDGMAGYLDFLVEVSQRKSDRAHLQEEARKGAGWCIGRARRNGGFRLHTCLPAGAFVAGFYEGWAGLGYEFLRLAFPEKLPSVLLWN